MLLGWGDRYSKVENSVSLFPEYNYDRLGQRFFARTAFAFLTAAGAFAFLAALTAIKMGELADTYVGTYVQSLSVAICLVAGYHYYEIGKLRAGEVSTNTELQVDALRYGDWAVTMPLLTLKFYAIIERPQTDYDSIFESPHIAAVASVLMIVLGSFVRIGLDELSGWRRLTGVAQLVGICCWVFSCICLVLLLVDIGRAAAAHQDRRLLLSFLFVWVGYPIVAAVSSVWRHADGPDTPYDRRLSFVKDATFSCLDIFAKGVFCWWSASGVFGVFVF